MKWGKYTLLKDFFTRTEKYRSWDRADKHARIYTKRRSPCQERVKDAQESMHSTTSTHLGTYISTRYGKGYPPRIFTNPNYLQNSINNDTSDSEAELWQQIQNQLQTGMKILLTLPKQMMLQSKIKSTTCDWSDEENTGGIAKAHLQATPRQPPPGWASWRQKESLQVTNKDKHPQESSTEAPNNKIVIVCRN